MPINKLKQIKDQIKDQIDAMDPKRKKIALVVWDALNGHLNGITTGLLINQAMGGFPEYENMPWVLYSALATAMAAGIINGIGFGAQELKKLPTLRAFSDAVNNGTSTWLYLSLALGNLYTLLCTQLGGFIDVTSNTTELLSLSESGELQCYARNFWPYVGAFLIAAPFGIAESFRTLGTNILDDLEAKEASNWLERFVKKHQSKIEKSAWGLESLLNSTTFAMIGAPIAWNYGTRWIQFGILLAAIGLGIGSVGIKKYDNKKYEDPANQVITFLGAVASVITFDLIVRGLGEDSQFPMIAWISMLASMLATVVAMGVYSGCVIKRDTELAGVPNRSDNNPGLPINNAEIDKLPNFAITYDAPRPDNLSEHSSSGSDLENPAPQNTNIALPKAPGRLGFFAINREPNEESRLVTKQPNSRCNVM